MRAILLANDSVSHPLPGIVADVYLMWQYLKTLAQCNISVWSNLPLNQAVNVKGITSLLLDNTISEDIHSFLSTLDVKKLDSLDNVKIEEKDDRLLVYYTGHATEAGVTFGDVTVSWNTFADHFIKQLQPKSQLMFVFDCCYPSGLNLPFVWNADHKGFKLRANLRRTLLETYTWKAYPIDICCLCSSFEHQERSISTSRGSLLTLALTGAWSGRDVPMYLEKKYKVNIPLCVDRIPPIKTWGTLTSFIGWKYNQEAGQATIQSMFVSASVPLDQGPWSWLLSPSISKPVEVLATCY